MTEPFLLPCPFCGGPAGFEECAQGSSVQPSSCTWSVGCRNSEEDCIGYQMLAHYNRKSEAAKAWNKRSVQSPISPQYAAELGRQVDELEAESAEQRQALQELYEFCCGLNDFRPDSKLGRKVKSILFNLTGDQ